MPLKSAQGFSEAFTYMLEDPDSGKKLLIAVLLTLANLVLPLLPALFLAGYNLSVMRQVVLGDDHPGLPSWQDWGRLLRDGARAVLIGLLYMLPMVVFLLVGFGLMFLPAMLVGLLESSQTNLPELVLLIPALSTLGGVLVIAMAALMGIVLGFMLLMALVHFAVKDRIAAAFHIGDWWQIVRSNLTDFLLAVTVVMIVSILSGLLMQLLSLTLVLCLLIPLLQSAVSVYTMLVSASLFGQAYRSGLQRLENQP